MNIICLLFAALAFHVASAQNDTLPDKNNPAKQIATPGAGTLDKTATDQKTAYKIEPEKNAGTVEKIKQRTAKHKQKSIKKYKGRKSNISTK